MKSRCMGTLLLIGTIAFAQAPSGPFPPVASVKQLMLDLIHPSSNDILLAIYRGGPKNEKDEKEWVAVRRAALTLAESGNMLMMPGRVPAQRVPCAPPEESGNASRGAPFCAGSSNDRADWMKDAKLLVDAGNAAYKAAQAKDGNALAAVAGALDASCTTCHKQYRPNVFPKDGGSK